MPRGQDTSRGRDIGPGSSLHQRIAAETAAQHYLFGTIVGTQDSGEHTRERPMPGGAVVNKMGQVETFHGAPGSRPSFAGAEHLAVRLAQMEENHAAAMAGLMQPPPDNAPMGNLRMVDPGMGRLSTGREYPVHTYVDERIKLPKKD